MVVIYESLSSVLGLELACSLSLLPCALARIGGEPAENGGRGRVSLAAGLTRAATPPNVGSFRPYFSCRLIIDDEASTTAYERTQS